MSRTSDSTRRRGEDDANFTANDSTERTRLLPDDRDGNSGSEERSSFARSLTTLDAFVLLITVIIGSGIFASPAQVDTNVPSPGAALLVWLVGGLLAWTGASGMAELGAAFPGEGGIQPYLRHVYGEYVGFLAGWCWVACVMPATLAILGIVFVETIFSAFVPGADVTGGSWLQKGIAVAAVCVMAGVNALGTKTSTTLSNVFAIIKLGTAFLVVLAGLVVVLMHAFHPDRNSAGGQDWYQRNWFHARTSISVDGSIDWTKVKPWEALGHYSTALYAGLWGYASWDKANYAAGELKDPGKQLPLAINTALPVVIVCYVLVNATYYILLPWEKVGLSDAIAIEAFRSVLGAPAAMAAAVLIALVVAGALNGNIFVAGRLTVAAARRGYLPAILGRLGNPLTTSQPNDASSEDVSSDPPVAALLLSALFASIYILIGSFRALLTFDGMAEYTFFFLTLLAVLILRYKEPDLKRPYKPPILLPVVFTIVSGAVVIRGAVFNLVQAGIFLGILVFGLVGFAISRRRTD